MVLPPNILVLLQIFSLYPALIFPKIKFTFLDPSLLSSLSYSATPSSEYVFKSHIHLYLFSPKSNCPAIHLYLFSRISHHLHNMFLTNFINLSHTHLVVNRKAWLATIHQSSVEPWTPISSSFIHESGTLLYCIFS